MRRRQLLGMIGGAAVWPIAVRAQQAPKSLRVGTANVQPRTAPQWVAFVQRMAELGYKEGENFTYDAIQIPNADAWEAAIAQSSRKSPTSYWEPARRGACKQRWPPPTACRW